MVAAGSAARVRRAEVPPVPAEEVEGVHGRHVGEPDSAPHREGDRRQRACGISRSRRCRRSSMRKADEGLSFSVVDHLRWDLSAIFEMAIAEKVIEASPATRLYTPKHAPKGQTRAMSVEEVQTALDAVDLREKVLLHMAILSGFRPGEMLGLQRRHVAADGSAVNCRAAGVSRRSSTIPKRTRPGGRWRFRPGPPSCCGNGWSQPSARSRTLTSSPARRESRSGGTP